MENSYSQMLRCLEFLHKQHESKKTTFISRKKSVENLDDNFGLKSDKVHFRAFLGGVKYELKNLEGIKKLQKAAENASSLNWYKQKR